MDESCIVHIGLLLGAGAPISADTKARLSKLIDDAFEAAAKHIENAEGTNGMSLTELTGTIVSLLEDSSSTNAGLGSELTRAGTVECDAYMRIHSNHHDIAASVGAVPDIRHPILIPCSLLRDQMDAKQSYSRLSSPNFLVGTGARDYGVSKGLETAVLTTPRTQESFARWKKTLETQPVHPISDTVGVIILTDAGETCVASSSGGPLLRHPGRIGPAALDGCGAFTDGNACCVTSGFGEDIVALRLAELTVSSGGYSEADIQQRRSSMQRDPYFGLLYAEYGSDAIRFEWFHNTESMVCAFGSINTGASDRPIRYKIVRSGNPDSSGGYLSPRH